MSKKMLISIVLIGILIIGLGLVWSEENSKEDMVLVKAGSIGNDLEEIKIENDFYISKYEVTQKKFKEIMGFNPSVSIGEDHPVEVVDWYDAVKYCNELSKEKGLDQYYEISNIEYAGDDAAGIVSPKNISSAKVKRNKKANGYRLPTQDEWIYAASGGKDGKKTTYAGSDQLNKVGWFVYNSDAFKFQSFINKINNSKQKKIDNFLKNNPMTRPVGEKKANEIGIYDMSGNVWEWTDNKIGPSAYLFGGSWKSSRSYCEVNSFKTKMPYACGFHLGFRIAKNK